jgi:hypothetical protein
MKRTLFLTVTLILAVAMLVAKKSKSQSYSASPLRIMTSSGTALSSIFEGVHPTVWGRQALERSKLMPLRDQSTPKKHCHSPEAKNEALLQETFDGGHLIYAQSCYSGSCAGHYAVLDESGDCGADDDCPTFQYMIDIDSGDPNYGAIQRDAYCAGNKTCCENYDLCYNPCLPGECF